MSKKCKSCNVEKDESEFYMYKKSLGSNQCYYSRCKMCVLAHSRKKYAEDETYRVKRKQKAKSLLENPVNKAKATERSNEFYRSISGRAKTLYSSAKRRSEQYSEFDISSEWIEQKLIQGYCEITKIPFDFYPHTIYNKNPYAPSIDRKDSTKGYTKENVRIVLWQVNLMRGEMTDEEVSVICKKFIEGMSLKEG